MNDSAGVTLWVFGLNSINDALFYYTTEHFLYLISEVHYTSWKSICTIYFWCWHNVCFFIVENVCCFTPFFLTTVFAITFLTIFFAIIPTPMWTHKWFRKEHCIDGKIIFRLHHIVDFGTQNYSIISEYLDLINTIISHTSRSYHSVYPWPWKYWRLRWFLTHITICCWL